MTVDGAGESMEVEEGVDEEKSMIFGNISLVEPIFEFFPPFLMSAGSVCDVASKVRAGDSVWVDIVAEMVGMVRGLVWIDIETLVSEIDAAVGSNKVP